MTTGTGDYWPPGGGSASTGYPVPDGVGEPVSSEPATDQEVAGQTGTGGPTENVGQTSKEAGQRVASTAKEQAGAVAAEAKAQTRNLAGEAASQVRGQADGQKAKAADGLRMLSKQLQSMVDSGQQSGLAADLARQGSQGSQNLADWLDQRDVGGLVDEVRDFARRKPGTFLFGCVLAGVAAGRLTRGTVDANRSDSGNADGSSDASSYTNATTGSYELAGTSTTSDPLADPLTEQVPGPDQPGWPTERTFGRVERP